MVTLRTLCALVLGAAVLPACGGDDSRHGHAGGGARNPAGPHAGEARHLPLWRRPPDKPAGPAPAQVAGSARSFALRSLAKRLRTPVQVVARPGDERLYVAEQQGTVRVL